MAATQVARDETLSYIAAAHAELWETQRAQLRLQAQWRLERTNWLTALLKTAWNDGIGALEHPEQWASFAAWQVNWVIMSDVVPLTGFVAFAVTDNMRRDQFRAALVWGVYAGIIMSRACSLTYHVFCVLNEALLYVDLVGICFMALGAPYVYTTGYNVYNWDNPGLQCYVSILFAVFIATLALLPSRHWRQPALVALASVGNFAALQRPLHTAAVLWFAAGYLCYIGNVPDRFVGRLNGSVLHSHVLWHLAASVGQGLYMYSARHFY